MNLQSRLDQFRDDNPYDVDTQAKRLLAGDDKELILHVLALGFTVAKQRQRHIERDYMKNVGQAPPRERLIAGRTTGSAKVVKIQPSKRTQNAMRELLMDVWRIGDDQKLGDATYDHLTQAMKREDASAEGHEKNSRFYKIIREPLSKDSSNEVRDKWDDAAIRGQIERVYGEFRKSEAA